MSEIDPILKFEILNSLQVADWKSYRVLSPGATFILHEKDESEFYMKAVGKTYKGMNRMIRKCIGRLNP